MRKAFIVVILSGLLLAGVVGTGHAGLFGLFGGGGGKSKGGGHVDMGTIGTFDYSVFQYHGERHYQPDTPNMEAFILPPEYSPVGLTAAPTPVPEPASMFLFGIGMIGLALLGRRIR